MTADFELAGHAVPAPCVNEDGCAGAVRVRFESERYDGQADCVTAFAVCGKCGREYLLTRAATDDDARNLKGTR